ncbi:MAG: UDP-N-acetylmuramoyl-L-alanyl-D-glutamate--2,6-diaminopimelate ligase [Synergistetes bacterium]|nr:UDP-N-acetylmuramoyl-L-alanyl-D-glutamate--2,6-diaminopimelate ligase [Synergistota bacterium]
MKLSEIVNRLRDVEVKGEGLDADITGITYDSRKVKSGYLFACVPGFSTDGHLYINDAKMNGAVAALVERFCDSSITQLRVESVRKVLSFVASWIYGNPAEKTFNVGITGTNGKTTTTFLIRSILENAGYKPMLFGTILYSFGAKTIPASRTTPEGPDIMEFIREGVLAGSDSLVMEISSHSLELHRVDAIEFNIGVLTNITPEHLDFHGTFESYREAKAKLFRRLKDVAILNADDENYSYFKSASSVPVISYGVKVSEADIKLIESSLRVDGMSLKIATSSGILKINSELIGQFNVYNILAAVSFGIAKGIDLEIIKRGIESIRGVPGRMEVFKRKGFPIVIVDYAHTPDALKNVLYTVKKLKPRRIFSVFGLGGNRYAGNRPAMGRIAGSIAYKVFITSDNARWENPLEIAHQIAKGCEEVKGRYEIVLNRKRAIERAIEEASSKDVVLITGKGHEDYFEIRGKRRHFSDREVVEEIMG